MNALAPKNTELQLLTSKNFIPVVKQALLDVKSNSDMYRGPDAPTVSTLVGECVEFFKDILHSWERLKLDMPEIADVVEFWIE